MGTDKSFKQLKKDLNNGRKFGSISFDFSKYIEALAKENGISNLEDEQLQALFAPKLEEYLAIVCQAISSPHGNVAEIGLDYCVVSRAQIEQLVTALETAEVQCAPNQRINRLEAISLSGDYWGCNLSHLVRIARLPALKGLYLGCTGITADGAKALADVLTQNPAIETLTLSGNKRMGDGVDAIIAAIPRTNIKSLYLSYCDIRAESINHFAKLLRQYAVSLSTLCLAGNTNIAPALSNLLQVIADGIWLPSHILLLSCGESMDSLGKKISDAFVAGRLIQSNSVDAMHPQFNLLKRKVGEGERLSRIAEPEKRQRTERRMSE